MNQSSAEQAHPGMTLAVYRINRETGEKRTVRERTHVAGSLAEALTLANRYPLCACPRCAPKVGRR